MHIRDRYGWEAEHANGGVLCQYNEDGSENPSTGIVPADVVRFSVIPRVPLLPRHDVLIDRPRGEQFVRRFGRGFQKRTETNLEHILALYKYRLEGGAAYRVHYSRGPCGGVRPADGLPLEQVHTLTRQTRIEHALVALGLTPGSSLLAFLSCLRAADKGRPVDEQPSFCRGLLAEHGAETSVIDAVVRTGLDIRNPFGLLLKRFGFPEQGIKTEYLQCVQTSRFRLWVFSTSGRTLVTQPEYEVYL